MGSHSSYQTFISSPTNTHFPFQKKEKEKENCWWETKTGPKVGKTLRILPWAKDDWKFSESYQAHHCHFYKSFFRLLLIKTTVSKSSSQTFIKITWAFGRLFPSALFFLPFTFISFFFWKRNKRKKGEERKRRAEGKTSEGRPLWNQFSQGYPKVKIDSWIVCLRQFLLSALRGFQILLPAAMSFLAAVFFLIFLATIRW